MRTKAEYNRELKRACLGGDVGFISTALQAGLDINTKFQVDYDDWCSTSYEDEYWTLLHLSCEHGLVSLVKTLLEAGADIKIKDLFGRTPLSVACAAGNDSVVDVILEHNESMHVVNIPDSNRLTPLMVCCGSGHNSVAEKLINYGLQNNILDKLLNATAHFGRRAIYHAAQCLKREPIMLMIRMGVDVNDRCSDESTVLHVACTRGNTPAIEALIEAGADRLAQDNRGDTPLHCATRWLARRLRAVSATADHDVDASLLTPVILILENGGELYFKNHRGNTPLDEINAFEFVANLLIEKHIETNSNYILK